MVRGLKLSNPPPEKAEGLEVGLKTSIGFFH